MGIDNFLWDTTSAKPGSSPPLGAPPLKTSTHSTPEIFIWFFSRGPCLENVWTSFGWHYYLIQCQQKTYLLFQDQIKSLTVKRHWQWNVRGLNELSRVVQYIAYLLDTALQHRERCAKVDSGLPSVLQGIKCKNSLFLFIASSHFFSENWKTG